MGRYRNHKNRTTKNKQYKKQHDVKRRRKDIDQIQDEIKKVETTGEPIAFELDDDLPGQYQYCGAYACAVWLSLCPGAGD